MSVEQEQNLDVLFGAPSLHDAYSQVHGTWVSAPANSKEGKEALAAKQDVINLLAELNQAPGQVDGDLIPDTTREERDAELEELRRELGIADVEPQWQPTTAEEVDRIGNKFLSLDDEEKRIKKQYANRMKSVQDRRNYLDYRYSSALETYRTNNAPKGKKFVDLPSCRLKSTYVPEHWKTHDEKLLEASLKLLPPDKLAALNVETRTSYVTTDNKKALFKEAERRLIQKKAADAAKEAFGEVVATEPLIPGLEKVPGQEKFSITVAA